MAILQNRFEGNEDPPVLCTPKDLLEDYKCFECLSEKEMWAVLVLILNEYLGAYTLPDELPDMMSESACFACLSDKQLFQAALSALAQLAYSDSEKNIDDIRNEIKCLLCSDPKRIRAIVVALLCGIANELFPQN